MARPRPTTNGRRSRDSPEVSLGCGTHSRLAQGHPRARSTFPIRPRASQGTLQELSALANHSDPRTCVRTFSCPAVVTKVNKGWHDYALIYLYRHDDAQGAHMRHRSPTPTTVSERENRLTPFPKLILVVELPNTNNWTN
jgi:hypothetical protein